MLIICRQGIQGHQNCGVGRCGGGTAGGESRPVEQRTALFIKGWDVGVEESFAAKLWRLSGDHCQGTMMAAACKVFEEGVCCPQDKGQGLGICTGPSSSELLCVPQAKTARNRFGAASSESG